MMKVTNHINITTLLDVLDGTVDHRTCVGQIRMENLATGKVEWLNQYVHFEFESGKARQTNGKYTLNCKPQSRKSQSRGLACQTEMSF